MEGRALAIVEADRRAAGPGGMDSHRCRTAGWGEKSLDFATAFPSPIHVCSLPVLTSRPCRPLSAQHSASNRPRQEGTTTMRLRGLTSALLLGFATAGVGSCSAIFPSLSVEHLHVQDVELKFRERESCGQIAVTSTAEPDWLRAQRKPPQAPPSEIAADPSRAKIWYENHPGESYEGYPMYLAQGCGHTDLYVCNIRYMCGEDICNHCVYMQPTEPAKASSGSATPTAPPGSNGAGG